MIIPGYWEDIVDIDHDLYIQNRYKAVIEYYWKASKNNKRWYKVTRTLTVILGASVTLIAFELIISPKGFPGDGIAMTLQPQVAMVITREVRRGRPKSLEWNRKPRILFVAASPQGMYVPQRAQLHAIRATLDPWIFWGEQIEGTKGKKQISIRFDRSARNHRTTTTINRPVNCHKGNGY